MTTVFAAFHRALRPSAAVRASRSCRQVWQTRTIHSTPVALKKKSNDAASDADDLFGDSEEDSDSLFPDAVAAPSKSVNTPAAATNVQNIPFSNPSLPPPKEYGPARFDGIYQFVHDFLETKTAKRQIRSSIWQHLFNLATTPEQVERVVEMLPKWRDTKRTFRPNTATALAKSCRSLGCPEIAVKVFGNRPKYGLDLTLNAAHNVLYGLQQRGRVEDMITFAALYSVYNLPPVSSDLASTAFVMKACFKDAKEESLAVARALVPSLEQLLQKTSPGDVHQTNWWLLSALKEIEAALQEHGVDHEWLQRWMEANGFAGREVSESI